MLCYSICTSFSGVTSRTSAVVPASCNYWCCAFQRYVCFLKPSGLWLRVCSGFCYSRGHNFICWCACNITKWCFFCGDQLVRLIFHCYENLSFGSDLVRCPFFNTSEINFCQTLVP